MAASSDSLELGRFSLSSGEGRRLEFDVLVEPLEFGGQRYTVEPATVPALVDVARMTTGYSLRLRYSVSLHGPCQRCLEDAAAAVEVDAREVDQPGGGEELLSPYLTEDELDLGSWARDALALALPERILCRHDCRGLCVECGANLNEQPDHAHEQW